MSYVEALNWISVGAGAIAAGLWLGSTIAKVKPDPNSNDYQIIEDGHGEPYDVLETARVQTLWNRWAALATAIAVGTQATALLLDRISS